MTQEEMQQRLEEMVPRLIPVLVNAATHGEYRGEAYGHLVHAARKGIAGAQQALDTVSQPPSGIRGVYFVLATGTDRVKIGCTSHFPSRIGDLESGSPLPLELLSFFNCLDDPAPLELAMHERFAASRLHGEWFRVTPEMLEFLRDLKKEAESPCLVVSAIVAAP